MQLFTTILFAGTVALASQGGDAAGTGTVERSADSEIRSEAGARKRPVVTIDSLVSEALEKNPELNFYRAEIDVARGERRTAGAWTNPEVTSDIGRKRSSGAGLSAEGTAWSVSVLQPFEFPGRLGLRKAIANQEMELAQLGIEQFKAALSARVRSVAFNLLIAQQKAASAKTVESRGKELVDILVQRDPAGVSPLLEMRIIEASVMSLKASGLAAVVEARRAQYELNQLRGAPLSDEVQIAEVDLALTPLPPVEELLTIASTNNFQLRIRAAELRQQGFRVELARNERWPGVSVGPFYSQERAGEKEQQIGIGVSIPLPLWNRNEGAIDSSRGRLAQAETSLSVAQRELERSLREAHTIYTTHVTELSQWRTNILSDLREAAELGDRHYRLGAIPVATYVELQEKFVEAVSAVLTTQAAALQSLQEVELLTGAALPQFLRTPTAKKNL
jgi:cobalt-zinc-cadmium efflux system outer membrane protein